MRILLSGPMSHAVAAALQRHGHTTQTLTDVGLSEQTSAGVTLRAALAAQLDICTTDDILAVAPYEMDLWFNRSIIHLQVDPGDVEQDDAIDRLFKRYKRLTPARLYTVTPSRVKIRQLPTKNTKLPPMDTDVKKL